MDQLPKAPFSQFPPTTYYKECGVGGGGGTPELLLVGPLTGTLPTVDAPTYPLRRPPHRF